MFRSLRNRNYRLFAGGQVVSLTGTWMQRIAQDWLVGQLTGFNGTALGIVTALQFAPTLLIGMYGGVLADRFPKRRLLVATQTFMGLVALALGLLDVTGAVALWHVYLLAALLGVGTAVDTPTRQAFVVEMVGPDDVANAVSLNSATFNSARIVGPTVAGLMIATVGTGWVFLVNAASFLGVLAGLFAMDERALHVGPVALRTPGQLREALRYVRGRADLLLPLVLVFVIGTFGLNFQITMALIAKETFDKGAGAFGLLSAALASGSLIGALASARRGAPRQRTLLGSAFAFGGFEVATGLAPSYPLFLALLVPTGVAILSFTTAANSTLQLGTSPQMRGRVMALYILVFLGGTPFGAPLIGLLAEHLGPRSSLWVGGAVSALAALVAAGLLSRRSQVRVVTHYRPRPHVHVLPR